MFLLFQILALCISACSCELASGPRSKAAALKEGMSDGAVTSGYCVTWDNHTQERVLVNCPYYIANAVCNNSLQLVNGTQLDRDMCHHFNRTGPHCRQCVNGTGPAAFSNGIPCAPCSKERYKDAMYLLLYLGLQLFCVTVMYIIFAFFQLRITSSPLNVTVYFSQVIVNAVVIDPGTYTAIVCVFNSGIFKLLLTLYGIWNLDFFRYVVPPICVSESARNIHVLMFDYIVAIYPILLAVVLYVCIELHERHCKLIVYIWRPFQYCFSRLRRYGNLNTRESIVNTFASFLLLSYSKLLYTSLSFLYSESVFLYDDTDTSIGRVLFYDPSITYFGVGHTPYLFFSFGVIAFVILLPPILLFLYPTRVFGRCLQCCRFPRQDILQLFMDTFQGWYKDGTDGTTRDYRQLSSLYMFLRIGVGLASVLVKGFHQFDGSRLPWVVVGLLQGGFGVFFLVVQPYKKSYMNTADGTILLLFGAMAIMVGGSDPIVQGLAYLLSTLPLAVFTAYVTWKLTKSALPCLKQTSRRLIRKIIRENNNKDEFEHTGISGIDRVLHPGRYELRTSKHHPQKSNEGGTPPAAVRGEYGATWSAHEDSVKLQLASSI